MYKLKYIIDLCVGLFGQEELPSIGIRRKLDLYIDGIGCLGMRSFT